LRNTTGAEVDLCFIEEGGREQDSLGALLLPRTPHRRGALGLRVRQAATCLGPTRLSIESI
jgi:hypothetical protein